MQRAIEILRGIDAMTLRGLVGPTIVSAVEAVTPADMERQLAEILFLKHGTNLLDDEQTRLTIIASLPQKAAENLAEVAGISYGSRLDLYSKLGKFFKTNSVAKSAKLVAGLGLSDDFKKQVKLETRSGVVKITSDYGTTAKLKGYLHPYQKTVKDQVSRQVLEPGVRQIMVQMPTGAGKTYTALETVVDVLRSRSDPQYIVWIVNSNELAEQAFEAFCELWKVKGDREIFAYRYYSQLGPETLNDETGIIFASFATYHSILTTPGHHLRPALEAFRRNTSLLIVDEAHASTAETYKDSVVSFLDNANIKLVGLTATPGRNTPEQIDSLVDLYERNLVQLRDEKGKVPADPVKYLQLQGYLADIVTTTLETGIEVQAKDEGRARSELASNPARNQKILEQIELAHGQGEATLVFSCTLDHVYALKILCESKAIPCRLIVGATGSAERVEILDGFRKGEFNILINYDILSTGVDLPNIDKIIVTRPIGSPILFSQILGRALRGPKNGGNPANKVVTLIDNIRNFDSPQMLFQLYWESWGI
jgi:DNA repair protein RadD